MYRIFGVLVCYGLVFLFSCSLDKCEQGLSDVEFKAAKYKIDSVNAAAFKLAFSDQEKTREILRDNMILAKQVKDSSGYLEALNIIGIAYDLQSDSDSSIYYFSKTLELSKKWNFNLIAAKAINNLGMVNWNQNNLLVAQQYFFESLEFAEKKNVLKDRASSLSNIGLIYQELGMYDKSLEYLNQALAIHLKDKKKKAYLPIVFNNIAICYTYMNNKKDSAVSVAEKGIKLAYEVKDMQVASKLHNTLGNVYLSDGNNKKALEYFFKSIEINQNFNQSNSIYKTYNSVSETYLNMGEYKNALQYALRSEETIRHAGMNLNWEVYLLLARINYNLGNNKIAEQYLARFNHLRDSVFSQEHSKMFAEVEILYQKADAERGLAQAKTDLAQELLKVRSRNMALISSGIGVFLLALLAYAYNQKQITKRKQLKKEIELKDQLALAEIKSKLFEERNRISKDLHDNIGSQLMLVSSSIDNISYQTPQKEVKESLDTVSQFSKLAIHQLRDTIWVLNQNNLTLDDFYFRVLDYINKAKYTFPAVKFSNSISGKVNTLLRPEIVTNLLNISKEIINNSLKYSNASNIGYCIEGEDKLLRLNVSDNGIGFDKTSVNMGNGLVNIDSRIAKIKGTYTLNTEPGKGTRYSIVIKI